MDFEKNYAATQTGETLHGLTYDTGAALLIATYSNEIAAYRSRRNWRDILNAYFLLDCERDYDIWVTEAGEDEQKFYMLTCSFHSACGRYAFWRVINEQSTEAEEKLATTSDCYRKPSQWSSLWKQREQKGEDHWMVSSFDREQDDTPRSFVEYLKGFLK